MSTITGNALRADLRDYNRQLASSCERRGLSLRTYKILKATSQLAGILAGVYAMSLGADPLQAFVLITLIYVGPEALEHYLLNGDK